MFEDNEKLWDWLKKTHVALSRLTLLALLKSSFGSELVIEELGRVEQSMFS